MAARRKSSTALPSEASCCRRPARSMRHRIERNRAARAGLISALFVDRASISICSFISFKVWCCEIFFFNWSLIILGFSLCRCLSTRFRICSLLFFGSSCSRCSSCRRRCCWYEFFYCNSYIMHIILISLVFVFMCFLFSFRLRRRH